MCRKMTILLSVSALLFVFSSASYATVLDVLFVYPPEVKSDFPGQSELQSKLISRSNSIYKKNNMDIQLRTVLSAGAQVSVYPTGATPKSAIIDSSILGNLAKSTAILALRNQYKPDIVVYIGIEYRDSEGASLAGVASLPKKSEGLLVDQGEAMPSFVSRYINGLGVRYAVMAVNTKTTGLTFVHEIGHLMGAHHGLQRNGTIDRGNPIPSATGYGIENGFRTIMSSILPYLEKDSDNEWLSTTPQKEYFSTPGLAYDGIPMGNDTYNAKDAVLITAKFISQYSDCLPLTGDNCKGYEKQLTYLSCMDSGMAGEYMGRHRRWKSGANYIRRAIEQCGDCGYHRITSGSRKKYYCNTLVNPL